MMSYKLLALTLFSCAVSAAKPATTATPKPPATLYTKEPCAGKTFEIPANGTCTLLPKELQKNINGAKLPVDVVCDFYTDTTCQAKDALYIGMEDPGVCSFSKEEIQNKTVSVYCYDGSAIYDDE